MASYGYFSFISIFITASMISSSVCYSWNDSDRLMSDMLIGYNLRHRPILNQSRPITVNVSFYLIGIQEFEEVKQKFSAFGMLFIYWQDEKIFWNPALYGGIETQSYKLNEIWYPILILANPYNDISPLGADWMKIRMWSNGFAFFGAGSVFRSTCNIDVTYYPFDTQMCKLDFVPSSYDNTEIKLNSLGSQALLDYYTENGEWKLLSNSIQVNEDNFFTITFKLKRKPLYLVINVILPILFMSLINCLVFVLPPESGERISYSVTVLLALAVFLTLVGENIPKTSEPISILSFFLMLVFVLSTLMCVVAMLNLRVYFKPSVVPVPAWCVSFTRVVTCGSRKQQNKVIEFDDVRTAMEDGYTEENDIKIRMANNKNNTKDDDINKADIGIKWQDVSSAIDTVCVLVFMTLTLIAASLFIAVLVMNS